MKADNLQEKKFAVQKKHGSVHDKTVHPKFVAVPVGRREYIEWAERSLELRNLEDC